MLLEINKSEFKKYMFKDSYTKYQIRRFISIVLTGFLFSISIIMIGYGVELIILLRKNFDFNDMYHIPKFIIICIMIFLGIFLFFYSFNLFITTINKESVLLQYSSLRSWINNVDVGNCYDIVRWLNGQPSIKKALENETNLILEEFNSNKLTYPKNKSDYYLPFFVKFIEGLSETEKDTLKIISDSINYRNKRSKDYKIIWSKIFNISFFTGVLLSYKYSIDTYKYPKTQELGKHLIVVISVLTFIILLVTFIKHKRNVREENAKNFLHLCLKLLKEK